MIKDFDKLYGLFRHAAKCKEILTKNMQTLTYRNFDQVLNAYDFRPKTSRNNLKIQLECEDKVERVVANKVEVHGSYFLVS